MSALAIRSETSPAGGFDYGLFDEATASEAQALAERVRSFERRMTSEAFQLGDALMRMKERLGHGQFTLWLQAEFGEKIVRTAQRWMLMAETFGTKNYKLSYLPPTTLAAVAAPAVLAEVRKEIVAEIEAGALIPSKAILDRVKHATAEAQRAAKLAKLSPAERKKLASRTSDSLRRRSSGKRDGKPRWPSAT